MQTPTDDPWQIIRDKLDGGRPPDPRDEVEPVECQLCGSLRDPELEQCDCGAARNVRSLDARREREEPDEPTIDVYGGLVELDLGKFARIGAPVTAFYLPPDTAEQWGKELILAADEARGSKTEEE